MNYTITTRKTPEKPQKNRRRGAMNWFEKIAYSTIKTAGHFVRFCCLRVSSFNLKGGNGNGGYILAITHLGHLEPFIVSNLIKRRIRWMAREEFFRFRWSSAILHGVGAFPVDRFGVPVSAIRTSINTVNAGEVLGIFPEGGVKPKDESVILGGQIKRGACVISQRTGAPVVPVVILGADRLSKVEPWLPFKRGKIAIGVGDPVWPPSPDIPRRQGRFKMGEQIEQSFIRTYQNLLSNSQTAQRLA